VQTLFSSNRKKENFGCGFPLRLCAAAGEICFFAFACNLSLAQNRNKENFGSGFPLRRCGRNLSFRFACNLSLAQTGRRRTSVAAFRCAAAALREKSVFLPLRATSLAQNRKKENMGCGFPLRRCAVAGEICLFALRATSL